MKTVDIVITNDTGIHTRPGTDFVKLVKSFTGTTVHLEKSGKKVVATSLLQLMSLAVKKGDVVQLHVEGGDEEAIAETCIEFFAKLTH